MFGDKCRFRHNIVKCLDKNHSVLNCEKSHTKICKYQRDYGRCKFTTYCSYNHDKQNDVSENSEKILVIEIKLENLQNSIKEPSELHKDVDNKIEAFESKLKMPVPVIEEKYSKMT